jgi:multiple sugar transport system permease protein
MAVLADMRRKRREKKEATERRIWSCILALCLILIFLFPLYWMFSNSLKTNRDINAYPPVFLFKPTLKNITGLFVQNDFLDYLKNSVIIAFGATLIGLVVGLPAAYAIVRLNRHGLSHMIVSVRMIPFIAFLIPWFLIFKVVGIGGTHAALILTHIVITLPVLIWIMIGFFEDVPISLEESATIDGCSPFGVFLLVTLPLVKPGIIAGTILSVIYSWNNFMFALVLGGPSTKTLPVAIYNFMTYGQIDWAGLSAAAAMITLPVLVFAIFIQRYFTKALARSGIKG